VEPWLKTTKKLRDAMEVVEAMKFYDKQYPDAQACVDLLSKLVAPEAIPAAEQAVK